MLAIRRATVVFPVPGLPVKLMCRVGRWEPRPSLPAADRSEQRCDLTDPPFHRRQRDQLVIDLLQNSCTREPRTTDWTSASPSEIAPEKSTDSTAEPAFSPSAGRTTFPPNSSRTTGIHARRRRSPSPGGPARRRPADRAACPWCRDRGEPLGLADPVVGRRADAIGRR